MENNNSTADKVKEIKRSFRLMMNGVAAQSMREKGLDYKVNWGVSLPQLKQMAAEYGKDFHLAIELWKQDTRECKILATLIMPKEDMSPELVDVWMEQTRSQEIAEMAAFNLYQHLDFAADIAFQWLASAVELRQTTAYLILARLFMGGQQPDDRETNEFIDQASTALDSQNAALRHAALNCVNRFAELGDTYRSIATSAFRATIAARLLQ